MGGRTGRRRMNLPLQLYRRTMHPMRGSAAGFSVSRGLRVLAASVLLLIAAVTIQPLAHLREAVLADTDRQLTRLDMVFAEQTGRAVETVAFILRNAIEVV